MVQVFLAFQEKNFFLGPRGNPFFFFLKRNIEPTQNHFEVEFNDDLAQLAHAVGEKKWGGKMIFLLRALHSAL